VYFSKHPDADSNPAAVFAVARTSPTLGVATFAIGQLLAGPTASERAEGYFTELSGALSGASNCGGADFRVPLNTRGTHAETGTATLQFCRTLAIPGELAGGRMAAEMENTLRQFSNITNVVILTQSGACFNDLSGLNRCLSAYVVKVFFSQHPASDNDPSVVSSVGRLS